ncbi:MAG: extracellular solute-binding protein [Phycisphaerales bacterium]|nr:extracellular solute-binding protein [Planctomycetota bacterium]MCH8507588.1 extracellular solute-binding protein [Phycisphaerales bacterium]
MSGRIIITVLLGIILGVPFALTLGRGGDAAPADAERIIVITPHVPQIRAEFGRAFSEWHLREHGTPAVVDWRTPGGTSEIRKQLEAMFSSSIKNQVERGLFDPDQPDDTILPPGAIEYDLFFGGGSFDHGQTARPMSIAARTPDGRDVVVRIRQSAPAGFTQDELDDLFGHNSIGPQQLYDPEQRWIGTALSSFGIVFNREVLARLGLPEPTSFASLTDPRLIGWVALADPRQSGSVTTTFDSILGNEGWERGWRILRGMCGTTRYFTNSSTKPPIDVSMGEAAAGLAIDFYGRGQAQVIADTGGGDRVGYTDPAGSVYVDADPVSLLNGAPNPELAKRFIRFTLTEEAQALWQFRASHTDNPVGPSGQPMGPRDHELRRMPVRRMMYERHMDYFIDQVDPFEIVSDVQNPGWRAGVQVMMGAFGVDLADECRNAYAAIDRARRSAAFTAREVAELEALFYAFPETRIEALTALPGFADLSAEARSFIAEREWRWTSEIRAWSRRTSAPVAGPAEAEVLALAESDHRLPFTQDTFDTIRNEWRQPGREARLRIEYTKFFRENYRTIIRAVRDR